MPRRVVSLLFQTQPANPTPASSSIGRLAKTSPTYVDCNDEGVEFIEARNDCPLLDFLKHSEHEDLDQLFPDNLIWYNAYQSGGNDANSNNNSNSTNSNSSNISISPLTIQVSRFACGGVAVAASLSHKIADAGSLLNFFNHWATVTRSPNDASHINPHFISHQTRNLDLPKNLPHRQHHGDYVTRSFLFPESMLNGLKSKVIDMTKEAGHPIKNVTRIEALTWLLHTRLLASASLNTKSGTFKASGVCRILGMRNNLVETLPQTTVGNLFLTTEFPTKNQSDLAPNMFISQLRKTKKEIRSIPNLETVIETATKSLCSETAILEALKRLDDYYIYSNLYGLPTYEIDFGWGKPVKLSIGGALKNVIILMDTPNRNGIEALVSLERQEMEIIQNDPELLALC